MTRDDDRHGYRDGHCEACGARWQSDTDEACPRCAAEIKAVEAGERADATPKPSPGEALYAHLVEAEGALAHATNMLGRGFVAARAGHEREIWVVRAREAAARALAELDAWLARRATERTEEATHADEEKPA